MNDFGYMLSLQSKSPGCSRWDRVPFYMVVTLVNVQFPIVSVSHGIQHNSIDYIQDPTVQSKHVYSKINPTECNA